MSKKLGAFFLGLGTFLSGNALAASDVLQQVPIQQFQKGIQYYDLIGSINKTDPMEFFDSLEAINIEQRDEIKFHLPHPGSYYGVVSGDTLQDFEFKGLKSPSGKVLKTTKIAPCDPDIQDQIKKKHDLSQSSDPNGHFVVCSLQNSMIQKFYVFLIPANLSQSGDWTLMVKDNGILEGNEDGDDKPSFLNADQMPFFHESHLTGSTLGLEVSEVKTTEENHIRGVFNSIVNKGANDSLFEVYLEYDHKPLNEAFISLQTDYGTVLNFQENPSIPGDYLARANIKTTLSLSELVAKRQVLTIEAGGQTYYSWIKF